MPDRSSLSVAARVAVAGQCAVIAGFVVVGLASAQAAQGWSDLALVAIALAAVTYLIGLGGAVLLARRSRSAPGQALVVLLLPAVVVALAVLALRRWK